MTIYLDVPFAEKDKAKALGARWDPKKRMWFIPEGVRTFALWPRWKRGRGGK